MATSGESAPSPVRVLIADDHAGIRDALRRLLDYQTDMRVVGAAGDGQMAVELAATQAPEIILMDLSMPGMDGVEAARQILQHSPEIKILIVSSESRDRLDEAMTCGAHGYFGKGNSLMRVPGAIREILKGNEFMCP